MENKQKDKPTTQRDKKMVPKLCFLLYTYGWLQKLLQKMP